VLFGRQSFSGQNVAITVDEMAEWLDTINYEVTPRSCQEWRGFTGDE